MVGLSPSTETASGIPSAVRPPCVSKVEVLLTLGGRTYVCYTSESCRYLCEVPDDGLLER